MTEFEVPEMDFGELFTDENKPQTGWMKFSTIGDKIAGQFLEKKVSQSDFGGDQLVLTLENVNGVRGGEQFKEASMKVAVKANDYFQHAFRSVQPGDFIGLSFSETIPSTTKGHQDAKRIEPFIKKATEEQVKAFYEKHPELNTF